VEITPRCLPITAIPAFCAAKRRIFLSATFSNNSVLISDFDVPEIAVTNPITPSRANDLGDRMILVPQEFNPELTDEKLREMVTTLSEKHNVVVIVPSNRRADFWKDPAALILTTDNLAEGVKKLTDGHVGLVVLVNKYDGIDLPNDACRVLVIDGVPNVRSKIDRIEQELLWNSEWIQSRHIQRIEQGMGRGVRSQEDYCAVILMGSVLTSALYVTNSMSNFTPATRVQLQLAEKLAGQLKDAPIKEVQQVIETFLGRDKKWVAVSRSALAAVKQEATATVDPIAKAQRTAFNAAVVGDNRTAVNVLSVVAQGEENGRVKGWLKQEIAFYEHYRSPSNSQAILSSAIKLNNQVTRPISGFEYSKLSAAGDQAAACSKYLHATFSTPNEFVLFVNALLDDLKFVEDASDPFERAMAEIGQTLGFGSARPDTDIGKGPDNLWCVGALKFFVIEDKNGATTDTISKHDCDQLGGSVRWFEQNYDSTCTKIPIIVHPSNVFGYHGTPPTDTRVITRETLEKFRDALKQFSSSMSKLDNFGTRDEASRVLNHHKFLPEAFINAYTVKFKKESK
jgi:hypothetical protein